MSARKVVVLGYGVTGRAVESSMRSRGDQVIVLDDAALGDEVLPVPPAGPDLDSLVKDADLIVPSPGVHPDHPLLRSAISSGVPVRSEVELAAGLRPSGQRLVAITGTNGKTTVTTLVTKILVASGVGAVAAGNIGDPLIDAISSGAEVVVAEVSSFQLEFTDAFHPDVSCWLNLSSNHLDWHPDARHYRRAKAKVWCNQGPGDTAVYNGDDASVAEEVRRVHDGVAVWQFSTRHPADFSLRDGWLVAPAGSILAAADLPRALPHDVANSLAAAACALAAGGSIEGCRAALTVGAELPHRLSFVKEIGGTRWYDDSKATTPAAVLAAVAGFDSVVLIAGGRNKGLDLAPLAQAVPPVRAVVAIGESAAEVEAIFKGLVAVRQADSMVEAVDAAASLAQPGDAVLLSPGCASFDWYPSYTARGEAFSAAVVERLESR